MDETRPRPISEPTSPLPMDDAQAAWAARVRANREQAERLRQDPPDDDFYAPLAAVFRADPTRRDDPALNALLDLARPDDVWLDVGAGGGRYSLAIARAVRRLIAVEPSQGMRAVFTETAAAHDIHNVDLRATRWPPDGPYSVDVALISHVGYDVEAIGPFLDALEAAASRTCVALLMEPPPVSAFTSLWPLVHGESQAVLPGLGQFLSLLLARGSLPEMRIVAEHTWCFDSLADAEQLARRRLWLSPDGPKADLLRTALTAALLPDGDGVRIPHRSRVGLVAWSAGGASVANDASAG